MGLLRVDQRQAGGRPGQPADYHEFAGRRVDRGRQGEHAGREIGGLRQVAADGRGGTRIRKIILFSSVFLCVHLRLNLYLRTGEPCRT